MAASSREANLLPIPPTTHSRPRSRSFASWGTAQPRAVQGATGTPMSWTLSGAKSSKAQAKGPASVPHRDSKPVTLNTDHHQTSHPAHQSIQHPSHFYSTLCWVEAGRVFFPVDIGLDKSPACAILLFKMVGSF